MGGTKKNPTYFRLGNHTEAVQVDYDPAQISYKELLKIFWKSHRPRSRTWSRQYMSAIFFHSENQKKFATKSKDQEEKRGRGKIYTKILPAKEFYLAEDYHQKYYLRQKSVIMKDFSSIYPKTKDFVASTAAARVNGYLAGYGTLERLKEETAVYKTINEARIEMGKHPMEDMDIIRDASFMQLKQAKMQQEQEAAMQEGGEGEPEPGEE